MNITCKKYILVVINLFLFLSCNKKENQTHITDLEKDDLKGMVKEITIKFYTITNNENPNYNVFKNNKSLSDGQQIYKYNKEGMLDEKFISNSGSTEKVNYYYNKKGLIIKKTKDLTFYYSPNLNEKKYINLNMI